MRKLGLTLVAIFCLAATSFAAQNQPTVAKWESNINVSKLGQFLNLTSLQNEEVANITEFFNEQMVKATSTKKNQDAKLHTAVYGNLKLMKQTLTKEQYSKYVKLMNATLKNRGIELTR